MYTYCFVTNNGISIHLILTTLNRLNKNSEVLRHTYICDNVRIKYNRNMSHSILNLVTPAPACVRGWVGAAVLLLPLVLFLSMRSRQNLRLACFDM